MAAIPGLTSPSGTYHVNIENDNLTIEPGHHIIISKYITAPQFFTVNGVEWLFFVSSSRGYEQTCVELSTGKRYLSPSDNEFLWTQVSFSQDGRTAAVCGCYWAAPYEIKFFDFSHPDQGWSEILLQEEDVDYSMDSEGSLEWKNNQLHYTAEVWWSSTYNCPSDSITMTDFREIEWDDENDDESRFLFHLVLARQDQTMVYEEKVSSDIHEKQKLESAAYRVKYAKFREKFPTNLRYQAVIKAFPRAQIFFFNHRGVHEDVDSDIQDVHFGAWLDGIGRFDLKSYSDKTVVKDRDFPTLEAALDFARNELNQNSEAQV
jgi:hypothetical protein